MRDLPNGLDMSKSGHRKVKGFAEYVRKNVEGIEWIWIDTCCINQDSSHELSEAINSMFKWYLHAQVCLAYLADVPSTSDTKSFERSAWFTRGWYVIECQILLGHPFQLTASSASQDITRAACAEGSRIPHWKLGGDRFQRAL